MKAIRVHEYGGPEVLRYEDAPVPQPGAGEALVQIHVAGLNFVDTYHRIGLYKLPTPFTPGSEAAGVVSAVGPGVTEVQAGDRVAYARQVGAYAGFAVVPPAADRVPIYPAEDHQKKLLSDFVAVAAPRGDHDPPKLKRTA